MEKRGVPCERWVMVCIRGSVEMRTVYVGTLQARAAVITRLSCQRAGQRFLARGVDDDGNAANFAETEQASEKLFSLTPTAAAGTKNAGWRITTCAPSSRRRPPLPPPRSACHPVSLPSQFCLICLPSRSHARLARR